MSEKTVHCGVNGPGIVAEFKSLIPRLSDVDFKALESDILEHGVQVPIEVWNGTIVDGHNRYEIATRLGIECPDRQLEFASRDEAIDYIYRIQLHRRNLPTAAKIELAIRYRKFVEARARGEQGTRNDLTQNFAESPKEAREVRGQIADRAGTNRETVRQYEYLKENDPEAAEDARSGKTSIYKAYTEARHPKDVSEWSADERDLKAKLEAGETVVINMSKNGHPNLKLWAEEQGLFVRIDRKTKWGNPFVLDEDAPDSVGDGDRDEVLDLYETRYLPFKKSLDGRQGELLGKALGCWCAPKSCHGHILKELAEKHSRNAA